MNQEPAVLPEPGDSRKRKSLYVVAAVCGMLLVSLWYLNSLQSPRSSVNPKRSSSGDFDHNGTPDLLWQNDKTLEVVVHYYGGGKEPVFQGWAPLNAGDPPWRLVAAADFDGNGTPDLIWQNENSRAVTVHYFGGPRGSVLQGWKFLDAVGVPGWTVVAAADFDGNHVPDLVWQNDASRQVTVHYYGGIEGAVYQGWASLNSTDAPGWRVVAAADFDGNGVPDLVWQEEATRKVKVQYFGVESGGVRQRWSWLDPAGVPGWTVVGATDFDGNGVPDLVYMEDATRRLTVHFFGGAGGAQMQGWKWLSVTGNPRWNAVVPR